MRRAAATLLAGALAAAGPAAARELTGVVYVDANGSGGRDAGEPPRAGVRVSNGRDVLVTGADGRYRFPEGAGNGFVAITRPDDFACERWYRRGGGDFALVPEPFPDDFFFVQVSDVHAYADPTDFARYTFADTPHWIPPRLARHLLGWVLAGLYDRPRSEILDELRGALAPYRDVSEIDGDEILLAYLEEFERPGSELGQVVPRIREALAEVAALRPAFVVNTGDLVLEGNTAPPAVVAGWLDLYHELTRATGLRWYETIGNNEIAASKLEGFRDDAGYGKGVWEQRYGPTWYSFDRGRFHFVALDAHRRIPRGDAPPDWELEELSPEVLAWMDADLAANEDRVLVVLDHEPFHSRWLFYDPVDDAGLLEKHGVAYALAGHLHENAIERIGATTHVTTGALSGMRWMLPPSIHPRGYRLFYAKDERLYSAWKQIGQPVLGFVHPSDDAALFASGDPPPGPDGATQLVAVGADAAAPFASLEIRAGGRPLAAERWGDYFLSAALPAGAAPGSVVLRGVSADGRVLERRLALSPD